MEKAKRITKETKRKVVEFCRDLIVAISPVISATLVDKLGKEAKDDKKERE